MNFFKRHLIITNLLIMAGVTIALLAGAMWWLDIHTGHGKVQEVPDVTGLPLADAVSSLKQRNLNAEVVDSLHADGIPRGAIVDQTPKPGDKVKPGRDIYLTVNAYTPRKISIPDLTGASLRQARTTLASLGFTNVTTRMVPSDYKDLVLAVKAMGVTLHSGTMLPPDTPIEIEAGEGFTSFPATDTADEYSPTEGGYSDQPIQWPDTDD
ncbi:MAG: PASTA domain-containing protein [Muribaculaceae bacterium]|nr:PASTA domain-containing protein [Muribaculaceae bacterium]